jgi:hypothetical protein
MNDLEDAIMMRIRKGNERGSASLGWLESKHSFSFADYNDPDHMGFGNLRVINEDRVQPGQGFGVHGHRDMEIISYIINGALEHKDNLGNGSVMRRGDVQRMTAGSGVQHSEFNPSSDTPVQFLQIWILPQALNLTPGYEQKAFMEEEKLNQFRLIISQEGRDRSLTIHQDVDLYASLLTADYMLSHPLRKKRKGWVQVVLGDVVVNEVHLSAGDGLALQDSDQVRVNALSDTELLLFDMG